MSKSMEIYLTQAIDKAEQAISSILYTSYPQINQDAINKIKKAIHILEDVIDSKIEKP